MIESTKGFLLAAVIILLLNQGCLPSYRAQTEEYIRAYQPKDTTPDYEDLKFWAAHPWKRDPSDSISKPLQKNTSDTVADVFFIHPTTLTEETLAGKIWNASLADGALNAKTDYTSILYQASVFNQHCRVFAPRYRQAHIYSFYAKDTIRAKLALDYAYKDVEKAFLHYMRNFNNGRPIIIAAHSQGTLHAIKLLQKYFDGQQLSKQLVAAYIIGLRVDASSFAYLLPCSNPEETNCINTWRTFRTGYEPEYINQEGKVIIVNPLSWTTTEQPVSRTSNKGSVLYNYNKRYKHTNGATINRNILWTNRPKFLFGFLLKTKNYHAGDYNLFYYSIRENIETRIKAYYAKQKPLEIKTP